MQPQATRASSASPAGYTDIRQRARAREGARGRGAEGEGGRQGGRGGGRWRRESSLCIRAGVDTVAVHCAGTPGSHLALLHPMRLATCPCCLRGSLGPPSTPHRTCALALARAPLTIMVRPRSDPRRNEPGHDRIQGRRRRGRPRHREVGVVCLTIGAAVGGWGILFLARGEGADQRGSSCPGGRPWYIWRRCSGSRQHGCASPAGTCRAVSVRLAAWTAYLAIAVARVSLQSLQAIA